jgi:general secretion pathway protein N
MIQRLLLVALAVLVFLATLLYLAPATWLDAALQRAIGGLIGMADAKGSLWRGNGVIQTVLPSGQVETLDTVRWTIDPWALLAARLHIAMLSERDGKPVIDAVLAPGVVTVSELRLEGPAAMLGALSPTLRAAAVSGRIALRARDVRVDNQANSGGGDLLWRDAGSSLTPVYPLGYYRVELKAAGKGLEFILSTMGGALNLAGNGKWQPGGTLSFSGTATPSPDKTRELAPLLRIIGKETGGDRYQIVFDQNAGLAGR